MSALRLIPLLVLSLLLLVLPACDSVTEVPLDGHESAVLTSDPGRNGPVPPPSADGCVTGRQSSGAFYEICLPDGGADNTLVIYSRGFVLPNLPLTLPGTDSGVNIREFVTDQGLAYAATSFEANGLITPTSGVKDLRELITIYTRLHGRPERVLLLGFSNGALLAIHALEQNPGLFDGAFASCAPHGSYTRQVDYLGDVFVAFQYFFPGALDALFNIPAGGPEGINPAFLSTLEQAAAGAGIPPRLFLSGYLQNVMLGNFPATGQLLSVIANTPDIGAVYTSPTEGITTVISAVVYNVFATNNAIDVLGGRPFDNIGRTYVGSADDTALNAGVSRYRADVRARTQLRARFEVSGRLRAPVVALHNVADPLVPFWQENLFTSKLRDPGLYSLTPVQRFGHCAFTPAEVAESFGLLLAQTAPANAFVGPDA